MACTACSRTAASGHPRHERCRASNPSLRLPHNSLLAAAAARRARRGAGRARTHEAAHEDVREQLGQHQVRVAQVEADLPHRQHADLRARGHAPTRARTRHCGVSLTLTDRRRPQAPPEPALQATGPMRCSTRAGSLRMQRTPYASNAHRARRPTSAAGTTRIGTGGAPDTMRAGPAAGGRRRSRRRSSRRWAPAPRRRAPPPPARSAGLARALGRSAPANAPAIRPNI